MASVVNELISHLVKKQKQKRSSPCFIELFFEIASRRKSVSTLVTEK